MATLHNPIASSLIIFSRANRAWALRSISLTKIRSKKKTKLISMARPMPFLYPQGHQIMVNKDLLHLLDYILPTHYDFYKKLKMSSEQKIRTILESIFLKITAGEVGSLWFLTSHI